MARLVTVGISIKRSDATLNLLLGALLFATACRGDGRAPNHGSDPKPTQLGVGSGSGSGALLEDPPPGTDELVAPPAEIASKIALKEIAHGLKRPVLLVGAPNDPRRRLFIVEQPGRIRVLQPGATTTTVFLDIVSKVLSGGERGLLGLAFHPQFKTNRRFFIKQLVNSLYLTRLRQRNSTAVLAVERAA